MNQKKGEHKRKFNLPAPIDIAYKDGTIVQTESLSEASRITGVSRQCIINACRRYGGGYSHGIGFRRHGSGFEFKQSDFNKRKNGKHVIVTCQGQETIYTSVSDASIATQVPAPRICYACKYGIIVSSKYQFKYYIP